MIGATFGIAILGGLFAVFAGQDAAAGVGFLSGLRAAMLFGGSAELVGQSALCKLLDFRLRYYHQNSCGVWAMQRHEAHRVVFSV